MTDELKRQMKSDARRRDSRIWKEHEIGYEDGYSIRWPGRFRSPAGKVYFLYEITNLGTGIARPSINAFV